MQIIENKALVLRTSEPEPILDTIKNSACINQEEEYYDIAVKWSWEETVALTSLGYKDIPSPILRDYNWPGQFTPFEHQKITSSFLTLNNKAFCFNEQGVGKTLSAIWAADYLMTIGEVKRALVLCPLSIMKSAWQGDVFRGAMHRSCSIAHGTAAQRERILADGSEFVVLNHDGLKVVEKAVAEGGFDLLIIDECSIAKNPQTDRWKVINRISKNTKRLWMMTGTPAAQSPMDAYGLAKLVNPRGCPPYYNAFRDAMMYKVTQFKYEPKPDAYEKVFSILQPAIRFEKKDCLDLPEVTYTYRDAPLTPQQSKYYKQLKDDLLIHAAGEDVSAVNAASKMTKLLQISGGAVYTDTGETVEFDVSNRINVVMETIEECNNKVLVFVPFTHTIKLLKDVFDRKKVSSAIIAGDVSLNTRADRIRRFQEEKDPKVLIIQPAAASHGLTLTAADTIIWYAPVTSVETYLQANARIDRPGQKNAMTIVHIVGSPVERRLYNMLGGSIKNHQKIIDLYRAEMLDTDEDDG